MDSLAVQLIRGTDKPDLIVADNNYYRLYLQSLQSIQRISDSGSSPVRLWMFVAMMSLIELLAKAIF